MIKRYLLTGFVAGFLGISSTLYAGESEIILKDNTTASGLTVKEETANTTIARFRGDGNVGIGVTAPTAKLEVAGDILVGGSQASGKSIYAGSGDHLTLISSNAGGAGIRLGSGSPSSFTEGVRIDGASGNVGIGTTAPGSKLHITQSIATNAAALRIVNGSIITYLYGDAGGDVHFDNSGQKLLLNESGGNVGIGTISPQHPLHMGSGAHVTTGGVWTNASSREYKKNIRDLTVDEAMQALDGLRPSRFNYKVDDEDEYVGFIAEDVPELVATRDRKGLSPMDITAVLTKVVQEQQKMLQAQREAMDKMKQEIKTLKSAMNYGVKGL